jgi:hypothetical protein
MDQVSQQIADLASTLLPQLLVLDHPTIELLRAQYARARIASIEATGVGFFIRYDVPSDSPQTEPSHFAGGNAAISITGLETPAGCVLFVRDGKLDTLELYCFDNIWPTDFRVLGFANVSPLRLPEATA